METGRESCMHRGNGIATSYKLTGPERDKESRPVCDWMLLSLTMPLALPDYFDKEKASHGEAHYIF